MIWEVSGRGLITGGQTSMLHTASSIVAVWRLAVRTTDDTQASVALEPVKRQEQTVSVAAHFRLTFALPPRDKSFPYAIEAHAHQAGLEVQRASFRAPIEHADRQLVLSRREGKGGAGIQLRGTWPSHLKTAFGTVEVDRFRISHRSDGVSEVLFAQSRRTAHRFENTRGLREAIRDQMLDESAGAAGSDVCQAAGEPDRVSRSTVLILVHRGEAARLGATRARADESPRGASEVPPSTPGGAAAAPPVEVELDEVKIKTQPHTGRKKLWLFTAVVRLAGWCYLLVDSGQEELTRQLASLLHRLGVSAGRRPLVVLADGAGGIRASFEALATLGNLMVI